MKRRAGAKAGSEVEVSKTAAIMRGGSAPSQSTRPTNGGRPPMKRRAGAKAGLETEVGYGPPFKFGDDANGRVIPCGQSIINGKGCWECFKNNGASCEAKNFGTREMVRGVCSGNDSEYWEYKCMA